MKIKVSKKNILRGFTLIELLVVIAIIGILSSVVLASLSNARAKARDTFRITTMKQVQTALELYHIDNGAYPLSNINGVGNRDWNTECYYDGVGGWNASLDPNNVIPGLVPIYLPAPPSDPGMIKGTTNGASRNCFLYYSDGKDYKFLDYNQNQDVNTGAYLSFIDPARNTGLPQKPAGCPHNPNPNNYINFLANDRSRTWAIWSSDRSKCW